jgi:hypothetical protein
MCIGMKRTQPGYAHVLQIGDLCVLDWGEYCGGRQEGQLVGISCPVLASDSYRESRRLSCKFSRPVVAFL